MRAALAAAALAWLLALAVGLRGATRDIDDEVDAALALAAAARTVAAAASLDDDALVGALDAAQRHARPRHVALRLDDASGRTRLAPPPPPPTPAALAPLLRLQERWQGSRAPRTVSIAVARADGPPWTLHVGGAPLAERQEAMRRLAQTLALLAAGAAAMLLAMRWMLHRALRPLRALLRAIAALDRGGARPLAALAPMPVRELHALAGALGRLDAALHAAQAQRRALARRMQTVQDDERAAIARELHDEFGQRLTALRVDAAWLGRRVAGDPALARVVDGIDAQCAQVQQDLRTLLARLRPPIAVDAPDGHDPRDGDGGLRHGRDGASGVAPAELDGQLRALAAAWSRHGDGDDALSVTVRWRHDDGHGAVPWDLDAEPRSLPPALAATLHRLSQEGLTNVARHAGARRAWLTLMLREDGADGDGGDGSDGRGDMRSRPGPDGAAPRRRGGAWLVWSLVDDGIGLSDPAAASERGNGLAGMRERAWAQGATLAIGGAGEEDGEDDDGGGDGGTGGGGGGGSGGGDGVAAGRGLRLLARFALPWPRGAHGR